MLVLLSAILLVVQAVTQAQEQVPLLTGTIDLGNPPASFILDERAAVPWNCTLRGWVRAPDLSPDQVIPGEARLSANGSDCGEIAGWAVGLRFKERAIVKLRNPLVTDFPVKPTRPPINFTRSNTMDFNDIYTVQERVVRDRNDEEYNTELDAYNRAIANRSLWIVEGVERVVFNVGKQLPFSPDYSNEDLDVIEPFYVHVPNTNFPPIEDRTWSSQVVQGADEQLLNAETLFEYYFKVTLSNGTNVDIRAGRAGFIPVPLPDALPARDWPLTESFSSPRPNSSVVLDSSGEWHDRGRKLPECDEGSLARFNISIEPIPPIATQGRNVTLDITLTRQGNGSEHPSVLNVYLNTERDLDWAKDRLGSDEAYNTMLQGNSPLRRINRYRRNDYLVGKLLTTKPKALLERERHQREVSGGSSSSYGLNRQPLQKGQGRYDFDEKEPEVRDEYTFQVELEVPYNALPSFNATFQSFHPRIRFDLHTVFLCAIPAEADDPSDNITARDKEWIEGQLPPRKQNARRTIQNSGLYHQTSMEIDLVLPTTRNATIEVKPYSDTEALAPVISLDSATPDDFPLLSHEIREERADELLRSRYEPIRHSWISCGTSCCNLGGAEKHAAKMWQQREIILNGMGVE